MANRRNKINNNPVKRSTLVNEVSPVTSSPMSFASFFIVLFVSNKRNTMISQDSTFKHSFSTLANKRANRLDQDQPY